MGIYAVKCTPQHLAGKLVSSPALRAMLLCRWLTGRESAMKLPLGTYSSVISSQILTQLHMLQPHS